jgi:nifR3 family TIM-barrel protein
MPEDLRLPTPTATAYTVRDLRISPNVVLSPMEGVTDLTFRRLIRQIGGVGLTVTEFVPGGSLAHGDRKVMQTVELDVDERPVAIQLFGRDPALLAEGARVVEGLGASICDINMGCPSKKVCAHSGGSALLKDPELVARIVRAVVGAVSIPVTVKMRSGFDAAHRNAPDIAAICEAEGASAVAIHWRTREDKYGGERAVDKIAEAKARLKIPVLGNGDIVDVESAQRMFRETGCDGVLIGRGAVRNPWLLRQVSDALAGRPITVVNAAEQRRVMFAYFDDLIRRFNRPAGAIGRMKMFAGYFSKQLPHGDALRPRLQRAETVEALFEHALAYFERLDRHEAGDEAAFEDYLVPERPVRGEISAEQAV